MYAKVVRVEAARTVRFFAIPFAKLYVKAT